jgi:hypothetical protein
MSCCMVAGRDELVYFTGKIEANPTCVSHGQFH